MVEKCGREIFLACDVTSKVIQACNRLKIGKDSHIKFGDVVYGQTVSEQDEAFCYTKSLTKSESTGSV